MRLIASKIITGAFNVVHLETAHGDIEVIGEDRSDYLVEVYGEISGLATFFQKREITDEEFAGNYLYTKKESDLWIGLQQAESWWSMFSEGIKVSLKVYVPVKTSLSLLSKVGHHNVHNIQGEIDLNSVMGNVKLSKVYGKLKTLNRFWGKGIEMRDCYGEFKMKTSGAIKVYDCRGEHHLISNGGNIDVQNYNGQLYVKTMGGNIVANNLKGEIKFLTWGGNINVSESKANIALTTRGGNIKADFDELKEYVWVETNGGNIRTTFPKNSRISLTAKANRVKSVSDFEFIGQKNSNRWIGDINGGGTEVTLKTSGGKVVLENKVMVSSQRVSEPYQATQEAYESKSVGVTTENKPKKETTSTASASPKAQAVTSTRTAKKESSSNGFKNMLPSKFQVVTGLIIILFMVYGINSILFFSFEMVSPSEADSNQNMAIFYLNMLNALTAFLSVHIFVSLIDKYIEKTALKYVTIIGLTGLLYGVLQKTSLAYMEFVKNGALADVYHIITDPAHSLSHNNYNFIYALIPFAVAIIYYNYLQKNNQINRKISEQEYQLLNLEKLKTKAQLTALEARINPHFLYNSLNSIAGLIHDNPDKAEDMTVELSKLFRATTGRNNESKHTLEEELSLVKSYLEIEQIRFGSRLRYDIICPENVKQMQIPRFLLQPLVENAIKHGISKIAHDGLVEIVISEKDELVHIHIHDNGPAFGDQLSGGYGLRSIREKLELTYGTEGELSIISEPRKEIIITLNKNHAI